MLRVCWLLPALICTACLIFCCDACSPDIGQPLDLNEFSGQWFFIAGTPINQSLSRCGRFLAKRTSTDTFKIQYTAVSHKKNIPITFYVDGSVKGNKVVGTWQLHGSQRKLGPFRHIIVYANYRSVLAMAVCSEGTTLHQPEYKFAMIWSRERSLPLPILKELKSKLGAYINQEEIRLVDHGNC
ncbi:uncharacterized protein LOC128885799 [Hylaeus anthracinus]|uniref:uncharacterized protein LOC128885799 n=1 Tax=Hylaeus anthracinus TaxID=313031 RepID=UPI0023BA0ABB|nr:uncharacterized protein LOC128885799 [Hylaeus anthracinus]